MAPSTAGYAGTLSPHDRNNELNALTYLIWNILGQVRTVILAKVISCTNSGAIAPAGYVNVLPLVNQVDGNGNAVPHVTIFNLPYFRLQAGAYAIIIDPQPGDTVVVGICDRDISKVKSTQVQASPGSSRQFNMADGICLGSILGKAAPTNSIAFTGGNQITITATSEVKIVAPTVYVDGNLYCTGEVQANYGGADQVTLSQHEHPTAAPGSPSPPTAGT